MQIAPRGAALVIHGPIYRLEDLSCKSVWLLNSSPLCPVLVYYSLISVYQWCSFIICYRDIRWIRTGHLLNIYFDYLGQFKNRFWIIFLGWSSPESLSGNNPLERRVAEEKRVYKQLLVEAALVSGCAFFYYHWVQDEQRQRGSTVRLKQTSSDCKGFWEINLYSCQLFHCGPSFLFPPSWMWCLKQLHYIYFALVLRAEFTLCLES